jgi:hypothetical protein
VKSKDIRCSHEIVPYVFLAEIAYFGDLYCSEMGIRVEGPMSGVLPGVQNTLNLAKVSCIYIYIDAVGLDAGFDLWL